MELIMLAIVAFFLVLMFVVSEAVENAIRDWLKRRR